MKIFETNRLIVKAIKYEDKDYFIELLSDPKIINPIPQSRLTNDQILEKLSEFMDLKESVLENEKCACGIFEKGAYEMIGLCLFLTNEKNEAELGYRFRVNYWGKGYGTEVTEGMINYYFKELNVDKVTADVNIENIGSIKILEKFMRPIYEFYNEKENSKDRRYEIKKENWLQE